MYSRLTFFTSIHGSTQMKVAPYLFLLSLCYLPTIIHNVNAKNYQQSTSHLLYRNENTENSITDFFAPIKFSSSGIRHYLQNTFNRQEYVQDVLPNNLSHFIEFLKHGKKTKQSRAFARSVFKLFGNKLKAAQYINAFEFSNMLEQLPALLEDYFNITQINKLKACKEQINSILYSNLLSKFDFLKRSPQAFMENLSEEILESLATDSTFLHDAVTAEQLRQSVVRFLEIGINKLVWSPEDHEEIWTSVKAIFQHLEKLQQYNIIKDMNDIDDLAWSLIHRFCFFLDISGSDLPINFYEGIKNDLVSQQLALLELEQEPWIETKSDRLKRTLFHNEARCRAFEKGIIVRQ